MKVIPLLCEVCEEAAPPDSNGLADLVCRLPEFSYKTFAFFSLTTSMRERPPVLPRALAEARSAEARSARSSRSIWWMAPIMEREQRPVAVPVSIFLAGRQVRSALSRVLGCFEQMEQGARPAAQLRPHEHVAWADVSHHLVPARPATLWHSGIELGVEFYNAICEGPVPLHMDALRLLKGSSLELDLHAWTT